VKTDCVAMKFLSGDHKEYILLGGNTVTRNEPPPYWWFLAWFTLRHWRWRRYVPPKRRWTSTEVRGVTAQPVAIPTELSQKMVLFRQFITQWKFLAKCWRIRETKFALQNNKTLLALSPTPYTECWLPSSADVCSEQEAHLSGRFLFQH
jgi:hypothetical protein